MPSRSRQLSKLVVLLTCNESTDRGSANPTWRQVEAAIRNLVGQDADRIELHRSVGILKIAYVRGEYRVVFEPPSGEPLEPLRVSQTDTLDIARIFMKSGQLHESFDWSGPE